MTRRLVALVPLIITVAFAFLASAGQAAAAAVSLTVRASATAEVPTPGPHGATASATFTIDPTSGRICYQITVTNLPGVAGAHIHQGASGVDGPIVVMLDTSKVAVGGQTCTSAKPATAKAILADPAGYYLNVHTMAYEAGAVRGQFVMAPTGVNAGSGGQAEPPVREPYVLLGALAVGLAMCVWSGRRLVRR